MMTQLSVQRMQLSDDPADWVWIRWQWTRPGARAMPFMHAYGFGLWEDRLNVPVFGPQIQMEGAEFRGSQTSPFPGAAPEGPVEMWLNGVPPSARGAGDVQDHCGAQWWDTEIAAGMVFSIEDVRAAGGQEQGGSALMTAEAITNAAGGQEQGGSGVFTAEGIMNAAGGQEQGGDTDQSGTFPPHPLFRSALRDNARPGGSLTTVSGLATGVVGDLDLVILVQSGGTIGHPTGLSSPFVDETGTSGIQCRMYLVRPSSYPSSGYQYPVPGAANFGVLGRVTVRDTADPFTGTPNASSENTLTALDMTLTGSNNLLLFFCCCDDDSLVFSPPSGYTECFTIRRSAVLQVWRKQDQPPGATGDVTAAYDSDTNWITFLMDFTPP